MKKGAIVWSHLLQFIIGAIILGLIIYWFFPNIFSLPIGIWNKTDQQGEFTPYQAQLTNDEITVDNSINSLICAINSIATGTFDENNIDICPAPIYTPPPQDEVEPPEQEGEQDPGNEVTGQVIALKNKAINKITGKATQDTEEECKKEYGESCVSCVGTGSTKITLNREEQTKEEMVDMIAKSIHGCFKRVKENRALLGESEFMNCDILDTRRMMPIEISEDLVEDMLETDNLYTEYGRDITGAGIMNLDNLDFTLIKTRDKPYCIFYDKDSSSDDIIVGDCRDDAVDAMRCKVTNFQLPQDVPMGEFSILIPKAIIGAHGRPRWLVYYEQFPAEKEAYWESGFWGKLLSWNTLGNVVAGATLNWAFGGGASKGYKAIAGAIKTGGKHAAKEATSEATEALAREGIEAAGKSFAKTMSNNGLSNSMRRLFIQNALVENLGLNHRVAAEITEAVMKTAGKKGGAKTYQNVLAKKIAAELDRVIEEGIERGAIEIQSIGSRATYEAAKEATKKRLTREIMEEMTMETGSGTAKGLRGIFSKRMTAKAAQAMIRRESTEITLKHMATEIATGNTKLLTETGERTLKYIGNVIAKEGDEAAEVVLKRSASTLDSLLKVPKEIWRGSTGVPWDEFAQAPGRGAINVLKDLTPIKLAKSRWFKLIPGGKTVATIGKTTINLPGWVWRHRYPVLLLMIIANELDADQNTPEIPIGSNKIGLAVPYLFGTAAKTYDLHPEALPYFITNKHRQEERLYLVSPCTSDFEVVKKTCSCVSDPVRWRWNFGGGLMDVDRGSIRLKPYEDLRDVAMQYASSEEWGKSFEVSKEVYFPMYLELREKQIDFEKVSREGYEIYYELASEREKASLRKRCGEVRSNYQIHASNEFRRFCAKLARNQLSISQDGREFITEVKILVDKYEADIIKYEVNLRASDFLSIFQDYAEFDQANPDTLKEDFAQEFWIDNWIGLAAGFLYFQQQPYSNMDDVTVGYWRSTRQGIDRDSFLFKTYTPFVDTSEAIKVCDSRGTTEHAMSFLTGAFTGQNQFLYVNYKIDCIESIPDVKDGYCYDYFQKQEYLKVAVIVAMAVTDIVITVASGGLAAPAVFLATGAIGGLLESLISSTEVWPLRSELEATDLLPGGMIVNAIIPD